MVWIVSPPEDGVDGLIRPGFTKLGYIVSKNVFRTEERMPSAPINTSGFRSLNTDSDQWNVELAILLNCHI